MSDTNETNNVHTFPSRKRSTLFGDTNKPARKQYEVVTSEEFQLQAARTQPTNTRLDSELMFSRGEPDHLAFIATRYSARRMIPYGRWTCGNGREVIFNREYQPIFSRINGVDSFADRVEVIKDIVKVEYFYGDHNSPVDYLCRKYKPHALSKATAAECRNSLMICLKIMMEYEPKQNWGAGWNGTTWNEFAKKFR